MERLRHKLDTVIDTVEHVVQEAQATQNDICGEFERQLHALSTEKSALEDENYQVRPSVTNKGTFYFVSMTTHHINFLHSMYPS